MDSANADCPPSTSIDFRNASIPELSTRVYQMSTREVYESKQLLHSCPMNIGGRIVERLKELEWDRRNLLDKVPELSVQSLSALIKSDSKRSELDEVIADALGVDLLWLVYGKTNSSRVKTLPKREAKEISEILSLVDL